MRAHLLFPNLAVAPRTTLPLQRLNPTLKHIAEGARIRDKVLELLHDPLG